MAARGASSDSSASTAAMAVAALRYWMEPASADGGARRVVGFERFQRGDGGGGIAVLDGTCER
ncbi:MAG TPA: hypothetical protein VN835_06600, partial [Steroidobacteraceae bacterium]|nr:hypothetical protein [Steroidobacteraceae bacterium]